MKDNSIGQRTEDRATASPAEVADDVRGHASPSQVAEAFGIFVKANYDLYKGPVFHVIEWLW